MRIYGFWAPSAYLLSVGSKHHPDTCPPLFVGSKLFQPAEMEAARLADKKGNVKRDACVSFPSASKGRKPRALKALPSDGDDHNEQRSAEEAPGPWHSGERRTTSRSHTTASLSRPPSSAWPTSATLFG